MLTLLVYHWKFSHYDCELQGWRVSGGCGVRYVLRYRLCASLQEVARQLTIVRCLTLKTTMLGV